MGTFDLDNKRASLDARTQWRKGIFTLNAARRLRFTADIEKRQEYERKRDEVGESIGELTCGGYFELGLTPNPGHVDPCEEAIEDVAYCRASGHQIRERYEAGEPSLHWFFGTEICVRAVKNRTTQIVWL